jgi:hypothetical protein
MPGQQRGQDELDFREQTETGKKTGGDERTPARGWGALSVVWKSRSDRGRLPVMSELNLDSSRRVGRMQKTLTALS